MNMTNATGILEENLSFFWSHGVLTLLNPATPGLYPSLGLPPSWPVGEGLPPHLPQGELKVWKFFDQTLLILHLYTFFCKVLNNLKGRREIKTQGLKNLYWWSTKVLASRNFVLHKNRRELRVLHIIRYKTKCILMFGYKNWKLLKVFSVWYYTKSTFWV